MCSVISIRAGPQFQGAKWFSCITFIWESVSWEPGWRNYKFISLMFVLHDTIVLSWWCITTYLTSIVKIVIYSKCSNSPDDIPFLYLWLGFCWGKKNLFILVWNLDFQTFDFSINNLAKYRYINFDISEQSQWHACISSIVNIGILQWNFSYIDQPWRSVIF